MSATKPTFINPENEKEYEEQLARTGKLLNRIAVQVTHEEMMSMLRASMNPEAKKAYDDMQEKCEQIRKGVKSKFRPTGKELEQYAKRCEESILKADGDDLGEFKED